MGFHMTCYSVTVSTTIFRIRDASNAYQMHHCSLRDVPTIVLPPGKREPEGQGSDIGHEERIFASGAIDVATSQSSDTSMQTLKQTLEQTVSSQAKHQKLRSEDLPHLPI